MEAAPELENMTKKDTEERVVHETDRQPTEGSGYSTAPHFGSPSSGTSTPMRAVNTLIEGCVGQNLEIPLGLQLGFGDLMEKSNDVLPLTPSYQEQTNSAATSASSEIPENSPLKENTALINGPVDGSQCSETQENSNFASIPDNTNSGASLIDMLEIETLLAERPTPPRPENVLPETISVMDTNGSIPKPMNEDLPAGEESGKPGQSSSDTSDKDSAHQKTNPTEETLTKEHERSESEGEINKPLSARSAKQEREAVLIPKERPNLMEIAGINLMDKFKSMVCELEQFAKFVQDAKAIAEQMETSGLFDSIRNLVDSHGAMINPKRASTEGQKIQSAATTVAEPVNEKLQEEDQRKDFDLIISPQGTQASADEKPMSLSSVDDLKPSICGALSADAHQKQVPFIGQPVVQSNDPNEACNKGSLVSGSCDNDSGWDIPESLMKTTPKASENLEVSSASSVPSAVTPAEKSPASSLCNSAISDKSAPSAAGEQKNNTSEGAPKPDPPHPPGLNPGLSPPQKRLTVAEALALNPPGRGGAPANDQNPRATVVGGRGPPPNWNGGRGRGYRPPPGRNSYSNGNSQDGWGGGRIGNNGSGGRGRDQRQSHNDQSWDNGWEYGIERYNGGRDHDNNNAGRNSNDARSWGDGDSNHSNRSGGRGQWGSERDYGGRGRGVSGYNADRQSGWGDESSRGNGWESGGNVRQNDRGGQGRGYSARQMQSGSNDGWGAWEPLED